MEYSEHTTELRSKCNLTSKVQEGHEKPIQKEAYEHPAKVVKVTSILPHEVLSPSNYKNLIKVCKIFVALLQKIYGIVLIICNGVDLTSYFSILNFKGGKTLQPMIVEKVSPVVVHLPDISSVNTASESDVKTTFDEKAQPIADALTGLPMSTFHKIANVLTDLSEKPNKHAQVNAPKAKQRKPKGCLKIIDI